MSFKNKIVIFGGSGLLGTQSSIYFLNQDFKVFSIYNEHTPSNLGYNLVQLNIYNLESVFYTLEAIKPDYILNCSGLTSVELCEIERKKADYLHVTFPGELAKYSLRKSIKNIHISTDHLWDGRKSFYKESDPVSPLNYYGNSKASGEREVLKQNPESLIIRTNFFGKGTLWRQSFSDWAIEKLKAKENFFGYDDIFFTPISSSYLLKFIHELLLIDYKGLIHVAGSERISKYDFIIKIANHMRLSISKLEKAKYSDSKPSVIRPLDMSLNTFALREMLNLEIPDINLSLRSVL